MKRTLIPKSKRDRVYAIVGLLTAVESLVFLRNGSNGWALFAGLDAALLMILAYVFQDQLIPSVGVDEYSAVIEKLGAIGTQLSELSGFLDKERARVSDTEATINKLKDEQTMLQPLVDTQRKTVEAILAAHSQRTSRLAWKERLFGFVLGLMASLIASFVYGYFKR